VNERAPWGVISSRWAVNGFRERIERIWGEIAEWNSRLKLRRPLKAKTLRVSKTLRVLMCGHPTAASIVSFSILHLSLLPFRPAHVIISRLYYSVRYDSESKG
jgi:hypothetical protein